MKTNIDELMREKGITNKELAALTGLHVKTIREVRKGLTVIRSSTLRKIMKVLKDDEWFEKYLLRSCTEI